MEYVDESNKPHQITATFLDLSHPIIFFPNQFLILEGTYLESKLVVNQIHKSNHTSFNPF